MIIIDNTYFVDNYYIPHAKPGISDNTNDLDNVVVRIISEYSIDCLTKCFGPVLYQELILNLDNSSNSWVDSAAEEKWDRLVNGAQYEDPETGLPVVWRGIRWRREFDPEKERFYSFITPYVYFYYERKDYITRSNLGNQIEESKNAKTVLPSFKVVDAWNDFVDLVQGNNENKDVIVNPNLGVGVDYYQGNSYVTLYKYINDMNKIQENTFQHFMPKRWERMNKFNI